MASSGTPRLKYPYKTSPKDKKKSYELRLTAQFGNDAAKHKLQAYNRQIKERKMEANKSEWVVEGRHFNRYKMMDFIIARVAGGESLPDATKSEDMPSMQMVYSWFDNHPDFEKAYRRAEEIRGHRLGEDALQTALDTDRENVAADKLKFEALSKAAARTNNRFQDKVVNEIKDEYSSMTPDQIRTRIQRMIEGSPDLLQSLPPEHLTSLGIQTLSDASPVLDVSPDESHNHDVDDS
jgi:hypothetical protein